jgi:hypothetical protein
MLSIQYNNRKSLLFKQCCGAGVSRSSIILAEPEPEPEPQGDAAPAPTAQAPAPNPMLDAVLALAPAPNPMLNIGELSKMSLTIAVPHCNSFLRFSFDFCNLFK